MPRTAHPSCGTNMMINYYQSLAIVTHRVGVLQKKKCAKKKKSLEIVTHRVGVLQNYWTKLPYTTLHSQTGFVCCKTPELSKQGTHSEKSSLCAFMQ